MLGLTKWIFNWVSKDRLPTIKNQDLFVAIMESLKLYDKKFYIVPIKYRISIQSNFVCMLILESCFCTFRVRGK